MNRLLFALAVIAWAQLAPQALAAGPPGDARVAEAPEADLRININAADAQALASLPGIGSSRAEAIIEERQRRRFRRIEDIMRVPGIGRKTFGRIRDSIRVE